MTMPRRSTGRLSKRRLGRTSVLCAVAAMMLVVLGWCGLMLVLGPFVLPPWTIGTALLVAAVILSCIYQRLGIGEDDRTMTPAWRAVTTMAVVGCVVAFLGDAAFGATYTVLKPSAPGGCQAVARESSFLMSGGGQVYSVHPIGVGWRTGSWTADDGIRPITNEQYELSWGLGGGALIVHGDGHNPVYPGLHEVACA